VTATGHALRDDGAIELDDEEDGWR